MHVPESEKSRPSRTARCTAARGRCGPSSAAAVEPSTRLIIPRSVRFACMRWRLFVSALVVVAGMVVMPASASASVPQRFVGMNLTGPFFSPEVNASGELSSMIASGVESVRVLAGWSAMQPYASEADVPTALRAEFTNVGGVPTNFSSLDQLVGMAASRRLTVLPDVEFAPAWDARPIPAGVDESSPPTSPGPFARFVAALATRYGTHGSFWNAHPNLPKVPIRMWQIWNEPIFTVYWSQQPFEPGYVQLLRATRPALRAADPGAKVVLAGLADFSWQYLATMYKLHARGLFDAVDVHPYTATPQGVITIIGKVRAVMNRNGDRNKPILAAEVSWTSSKGNVPPTTSFGIETTEPAQATNVAQAVRLLAANHRRLGLSAFYYFTWIGDETMPQAHDDQFNFAGLLKFFDGKGTFVKPVLAAFTKAALGVEGCRKRGPLATNCIC